MQTSVFFAGFGAGYHCRCGRRFAAGSKPGAFVSATVAAIWCPCAWGIFPSGHRYVFSPTGRPNTATPTTDASAPTINFILMSFSSSCMIKRLNR